MALEQLRAFREELPLEQLGSTDLLAPDNYPLLRVSELRDEHKVVSQMLGLSQGGFLRDHGIRDKLMLEERPFSDVLHSDDARRTRLYLALLERTFAFDAKLSRVDGFGFSNFFDYGQAATAMAALLDRGVQWESVVEETLEWFTCYRFNYYGTPPLRRVLKWVAARYAGQALPTDLRDLLITVRGQCSDGDYSNAVTFMAVGDHPSYKGVILDAPIEKLIDEIIGTGVWLTVPPCEHWAREALAKIERLEAAQKESWLAMLDHCHSARAARPAGKWLKQAQVLAKAVGGDALVHSLLDWFPRVDDGRTGPVLGMCWENVDHRQRMHEVNATVLRGLLWICPAVATADLTRIIGRIAASSYRKISGLGPRAVKVGNAAVYALSEIASTDAVGQLAMLKARVKFGSALKEIEKAFVSTANRLGLPVDEIEEMSVPAYGLTEVGRCTEAMGEFTAQLTVTGGGTELVWLKPDGKVQKSIPASVKAEHAEELKELQGAAKDIQRMLPAQRERIDTLFLQQKSWPLAVWRERYLDHPLVGVIARRLLWEFTTGKETTAGIWFDSSRSSGPESAPSFSGEDQSRLTSAATRIVDLDLRPIAHLGTETTVRLWHPIDKDTEEVLAWRAWLDEQQIQQPFKQAHREVYLLTGAERQTRTYSNRYAAHVLRQHQFNALCAARGWKNKLRLLVDAEFPPATLYLPKWNLRAEFWIEGAGDNYGTDTNETGTFLYLTTDQVRFYRMNDAQAVAHASGGGYGPDFEEEAAEPLPLEEIPPLVFSEVMRDVDLFVGVASVGNDPNWSDGGPDGRYRDYWHSYSFGDLSATAKTRREVLARLLPRLKIAAQCSLADKFLVVKGRLRTYKIHLGSGNILMEPNDQYLCIVPAQGVAAGEAKVFLPFEGDAALSVILSKAFLLADDAKIKDPTIVSQIRQA